MKSTTRRAGIVGGAALLVSLLLAAPAWAAGSGQALGVDPQAEAQNAGESRVLIVGADVNIGDRVVTGARGQVQILFSDNTHLVVGPNSALLIEDYLLRADASAGKLAINALSGTFRFVTGTSPKDRYVIKTPTGTISVRGTEVDITVDDTDGTQVVVYHGAVLLCNLQQVCVTLNAQCQVGQYDLKDAVVVGKPNELDQSTKDALLGAFPYGNDQSPLLREFWVDKARECFNRPVSGGAAAASMSTPSGGGGFSCDLVENSGEMYCQVEEQGL